MNGSIKGHFRRAAQTLRLMVGVGDYEGYLEHFRDHHPEQEPMTRCEYFRYGQVARYPTRDGKIKRCPC
jgi:uncharacterized short protein YbdD (DUF466 family)